MRILAISHSALVEEYQEKFDWLANKYGHQVLLITQLKRTEGGGREVVARPRQNGNFIVKPLFSFFPNSLRRHFYPTLSGYVRSFKPDLIYVENEPQSEAAAQSLRAAKNFGAKLVFFTWENIEQTFSGRKKRIEKKILTKADGAIAGNTDGKNILLKQGFKKAITVMPQYGINPEIFRPRDASALTKSWRLSGKFIIGYVGRLLPEKNIACVIRALKQLPDNCHFLVLGNGPEKNTLTRLVAELGLSERVTFIPAVAYQDIPLYMNLFSVLVLPSITTRAWKEQFGRVLPEAMACQTPVIGSDSGEIPNVIGRAGLIFPEGDITKLTECLQKLFSDKSFYNNLARQAQARAQQLYTNDGLARQMNDFFTKIISCEK
jgi:L-malate glycosyltransferase